jgi:hypothetical protein
LARTGRPRLTSTEMQGRSRADRVRQRVADEAQQTKLILLHSEGTAPEPPADLVDDEARALFATVYRECEVLTILAPTVLQACYALQRCNSTRRVIDSYPSMEEVPKHLFNVERDSQKQYASLLDKLGAFKEQR